jgi:hypothetical protein
MLDVCQPSLRVRRIRRPRDQHVLRRILGVLRAQDRRERQKKRCQADFSQSHHAPRIVIAVKKALL